MKKNNCGTPGSWNMRIAECHNDAGALKIKFQRPHSSNVTVCMVQIFPVSVLQEQWFPNAGIFRMGGSAAPEYVMLCSRRISRYLVMFFDLLHLYLLTHRCIKYSIMEKHMTGIKRVALNSRNDGSLSPDWWLKVPRNIHREC
jgi:hypothetical protein